MRFDAGGLIGTGLLLGLVGVLSAAPAPLPRPARPDPELRSIQGRWKVVEALQGGKRDDVAWPLLRTVEFDFRGDTRHVYVEKELALSSRLVLRRNGSRREWKLRPSETRGFPASGIYSMEGDTLRIAYQNPLDVDVPVSGPLSFDEPAATQRTIIFTRVR